MTDHVAEFNTLKATLPGIDTMIESAKADHDLDRTEWCLEVKLATLMRMDELIDGHVFDDMIRREWVWYQISTPPPFSAHTDLVQRDGSILRIPIQRTPDVDA